MQRGSVLPLLLIFVLVVLGGAAFFYFQPIGNQSNKPPSTTPDPQAALPNQTFIEDLSGLRFEFEFPPGYEVRKETEGEYFKRVYGDIRKNFTTFILYSPPEFSKAFYVIPNSENNLDKAILTVWIFQNPENLGAREFYDEYWYYPFVWGDFTSARNNIAPESIELIDGKEGRFGIVDYRDGKPKYIYLPLGDKELMMQIQLPSENNLIGQEILKSFRFE